MPWTVYTKRGKPSIGWEKLQAYQDTIRAYARNTWGRKPLLLTPVHLTFIFARGIPESARKRAPLRQMWCEEHIMKRPDLTNYQKAAEDALKNIIFQDDGQVICTRATKGYTEGEGYTCITITVPSNIGGIL